MAHSEQFEFVDKIRYFFPSYFENVNVLEVGSAYINGTVRDFFKNCGYVGIDIAPANCVDIVCEGSLYDAPDNFFDIVISCECFEHNRLWRETFQNMYRMCKSEGMILLTCASTGRPEHGTKKTNPDRSLTSNYRGWEDYYQNLTEDDFLNNFKIKDMFKIFKFKYNPISCDLYFFGIKW